MKETNKEERLKRSNIGLAILLGAIALVGTSIPYFYLNGAVTGGG